MGRGHTACISRWSQAVSRIAVCSLPACCYLMGTVPALLSWLPSGSSAAFWGGRCLVFVVGACRSRERSVCVHCPFLPLPWF